MTNFIQNIQNTPKNVCEPVGAVTKAQETSENHALNIVNDSQNNGPQLPTNNTTLGKSIVNSSISIKQLDEIFKKLDGKEGKEFADCAYSELVKLFKLTGVAPEKIIWEKNEGRPIIGDYRFYDNSVVFYSDYFLKENKANQIGIIAHELTHCKQLVNMLTTEGISVEKVAYAYAVSDVNAMLVQNPIIIQKYNQAKANGKEKEFKQLLIQVGAIKTAKELKQAHANTLKLPKHPMDSPEGIKAQEDLKAQYNYNGADSNAYSQSPLEKEAFDVEKFITAAYKSRK